MRVKNRAVIIILCITALICLILPSAALFFGDGFLAYHIRQLKTVSMAAEVLAVFLVLAACFLFIKGTGRKLAAAGVCALAFCYLHVTFLPMLVSGVYMAFLILAGRRLRMTCLRSGDRPDPPVDFLLGSSLVITLLCALSALGAGSIPVLRGVVIVLSVPVFADAAYRCPAVRNRLWGRRGARGGDRREAGNSRQAGNGCPAESGGPAGNGRQEWRKPQTGTGADGREGRRPGIIASILLAFILTMLLIQVGRMNITLDFDTLWYGVRSEYILDNGRGIYENPGMVGMAYVYSKGLEVLTLPLCDLASHSYLMFFGVWLAAMGIFLCYRIGRFFMDREYALLAAAIISAVPAILNMSISVKPDIITWVLQLTMIFCLLGYVRETAVRGEAGGRTAQRLPVPTGLILAGGAYLLSLAMKPTALVFSTAVFGMAGLYLIASKRLRLKASAGTWCLILPEAAALAGIWARTLIITGMPVTSVFTAIFAKFGFKMKYPFATEGLPQNFREENGFAMLFRRLYQMLLAPEGKDMGHVIIAWGTSLLFFLAVALAVFTAFGYLGKAAAPGNGKAPNDPLRTLAHVVFWPFLAVNLASLVMLYQVDGNYFILLYTMLILAFCAALSRVGAAQVRRACLAILIPFAAFNVLLTLETNWAWSLGFTKIDPVNRGFVNHEAIQQEEMMRKGNVQIWGILSADPKTRVIAFGDHPACLAFPCNVQSYKDITAPWGNVELVGTPEAFAEYMEYAGTDYVYVEAGHIGEESWSWSYGLARDLIADGTLSDLFFENGNVLARVDFDRASARRPAGESAGTESGENRDLAKSETEAAGDFIGAESETARGSAKSETEAARNLRLFDENYRTFERQP